MDYRYSEVLSDQLDYYVSVFLRRIIDSNLPQKVINNFSKRIVECKDGGILVFFNSGLNGVQQRRRLMVEMKVFGAACSNKENIQLLAFHAQKVGYLRDTDTSKRLKRYTQEIAQRWLSAFFVERFTAHKPGVASEGEIPKIHQA